MTSPFETLGLPTSASADEVKARYRELARVKHPDAGGDPGEFAVLAEAYREALSDATTRELVCSNCGGSGSVRKTSGFMTVQLMCSVCQGSGRREGA